MEIREIFVRDIGIWDVDGILNRYLFSYRNLESKTKCNGNKDFEENTRYFIGYTTWRYYSKVFIFCHTNFPKTKWQQRDWNPQPFSSKTNTQTFSQTGHKWLICVVSAYLYGAIDCMLLSRHVRVSEWIYIHSIVAWMSRNSLLETGATSQV